MTSIPTTSVARATISAMLRRPEANRSTIAHPKSWARSQGFLRAARTRSTNGRTRSITFGLNNIRLPPQNVPSVNVT